MVQRITLVMVGVMIGLILAISIPGQATTSSEISRLKRRVSVLEKKTANLNEDTGEYSGIVHGEQIRSGIGSGEGVCTPPSDTSTRTAIWHVTGLGC
jgi:hypothetical protein